jgi:hypothetical protein
MGGDIEKLGSLTMYEKRKMIEFLKQKKEMESDK